MKSFYERYWEYRKRIGHISQKQMPTRLKIITSMIDVEKSPVNILDVGCGEGGLGLLLREKYGHNVNLFGIDISKIALEIAKPYYNQVKQVDIEKENLFEVFNLKFDYIIAAEVLEHLLKPEEVLEKLKLLLNPKGYIIVSFPNFAFWRNRLDLLFGTFPRSQHLYHPAEHIHYWTFHSFIELLKRHDLRIERIDGDFVIPFSRVIPKTITNFLLKKFPNFFGFQIVLKTRMI